VQLGSNVFRDVLPTAQLLKVLRYYSETWNEFSQRNTKKRKNDKGTLHRDALGEVWHKQMPERS
jgi:hypothetical protein